MMIGISRNAQQLQRVEPSFGCLRVADRVRARSFGVNTEGGCVSGWETLIERIRLSNAPVVRLGLVLNLSDERSGISTEAAESGRGGEAGWGV